MDILVTYEDGTKEFRDAACPCLLALGEPPMRSPADGLIEVAEDERGPAWFFCGWTIWEIADLRGRSAYVWRIIGGRSKGEALTGTWVACRVESVDKQISRLTRERDAEKTHAARWKKAARRFRWWAQDEARGAAHLRRGAKAMLAVLSGENTDVKPSSIAASLVVWAEHVAGLSARADAAEKRLADLRSLIATTARRHESKRGDKQTTAAANALAEELFRVLDEFAEVSREVMGDVDFVDWRRG
jgi:hypothetical protein